MTRFPIAVALLPLMAPRPASALGDAQSAQSPPTDHAGWTSLAALTEALAKENESPAMGIAVLRDGKLEQAVTGVRELGKADAVALDDPWSIGSIGKPICSTVVAKLIEGGQLRFETTLGEALADEEMELDYADVTLEQIMQHRGGIPQDENFDLATIRRIVGDATTPLEMRARYTRDILARPPIAQPGARFAYSNAGYALLSHIAERTAGRPYEDLVRSLVFEPLGMKHSYIGSATYPPAVPSGHVPGPSGLRPQNMRGALESLVAGAGGGLYLSVADLARFGEAHLKGLRGEPGFLKVETIARLHAGVPEGGPGGRSYACGWGLQTEPGLEGWHGHNGSNGTFRAELAVFPEANLVVAAIVNRGGETEPSPGLQAVRAIAARYAKRKS